MEEKTSQETCDIAKALIAQHAKVCKKIQSALNSKLKEVKQRLKELECVSRGVTLVEEHPGNRWYLRALEADITTMQMLPYVTLSDGDIIPVVDDQEIDVWVNGKKGFRKPQSDPSDQSEVSDPSETSDQPDQSDKK